MRLKKTILPLTLALLLLGCKNEAGPKPASEPVATKPPAASAVEPDYLLPDLKFSKTDLASGLQRVNMDAYWLAYFTGYIDNSKKFWNGCLEDNAAIAAEHGGMDEKEANTYATDVCRNTAKEHYSCLNGKSLEDAVTCLQAYANRGDENGE